MKCRNAVSLLLALVMVFVLLPAKAAKADEPVEIGTYDELKAFSARVNNGESSLNAVLTADIVATDTHFPQIAGNGEYNGVFDGQGYTIEGINISLDSAYVGFFSFIGTSGVVRNVALKDVHIYGISYNGGIVGNNKGVVQNCCVIGSVSGSAAYSGGIVGFNNSRGRVQYCYYACETSTAINNGGGVAGRNEGTVKYSYYDSDKVSASGAIKLNSGTATSVSGLSTAQMTGAAAQENMTGFDFGSIWLVSESYPVLKQPETHELTVNSGTGSGEYPAGKRVTITANEPEIGMAFAGWSGADGLTFTEGSASTATATFIMPNEDVMLTATYDTAYTVTVVNGTGGGAYVEGAAVTVTANEAEHGTAFAGWTGTEGLTFTSGGASTATATFIMPAGDVSLAATYEAMPAYTVTVRNGTGGGTYYEGDLVTITAEEQGPGMAFAGWTGVSGLTFTNGSASTATATFTMPASDVTVTATFEEIPMHTVTVNNGTGSGSYYEGESVTITANMPETGMAFDGWTGADGLTFTSGNATALTAAFTMPARDVTVTATYVPGVQTMPIWVGGVQVTGDNADDVLSDGTVSFAITDGKNVLTLNNANITTYDTYSPFGFNYSMNIMSKETDYALTINLVGENRLSGAEYAICAILGDNGSLTITGSGSLEITSSGNYTYGIMTRSNLLIDGTEITIHSMGRKNGYAIAGYGVTIKDSTVYGEGTSGGITNSVWNKCFTIIDSTVTSIGGSWDNGSFEIGGDSVFISEAAPEHYTLWAAYDLILNEGIEIIEPENGVLGMSGVGQVVCEADGTTRATRFVLARPYHVTVEPGTNGTVTADKDTTYKGDTVTLTITPDEGYELASLTVTDADNNSITVMDNTFIMPASDVTVTATFVEEVPPNIVTVAYVDFRHGITLQVFSVKVREGEEKPTPAFTAFDQIGTYDDCRYDADDMWTTTVASTVMTDTVYVLKWINVCTVTFLDAEGAIAKPVSVDENGTIPADEIPAPEKEGYTLTGWNEADLAFDVTQPIKRNVTLTPVYTINTYTVTFVNNGETYLEITVQHGATMTAPQQPDGNQVFDGWYNGETPFDFDTPITGDLTLTAHWSEEVVKTGTRIVFADGAVQLSGTTPYVIWNGGEMTPAFTVEGEDDVILTNSDYTVEYLRNSEPGTGYIRVTVTKTGYDNPADRWFKIYLPASTSLTVENIKAGVKLTWAEVEGAAGYVIYRRAWSTTTNGWTSFDRWFNTTDTTWIDGSDASHKVYAGTRYQYGVKAYFAVKTDDVSDKEIGGAMDNYNLGVVSALKTTVRITTRSLTSVTSADGKLTVKWAGSKVFTGYQVQIATDENFTSLVKDEKIASATTYSKVYEGLTSGTTYYVRIRSYHVFNGMTYHGEWSNVKSAALN